MNQSAGGPLWVFSYLEWGPSNWNVSLFLINQCKLDLSVQDLFENWVLVKSFLATFKENNIMFHTVRNYLFSLVSLMLPCGATGKCPSKEAVIRKSWASHHDLALLTSVWTCVFIMLSLVPSLHFHLQTLFFLLPLNGRLSSYQSFLDILNEMNDYAGQRELIAENMMMSICIDLTKYLQELKQERKTVSF